MSWLKHFITKIAARRIGDAWPSKGGVNRTYQIKKRPPSPRPIPR